MTKIQRLMLDVLKPHQPNAVEFASTLAQLGSDYRVKITVTEVDEKTESIILVLEGGDLRFAEISDEIKKMGASVHSIDEVEVSGEESD